MSALCALAWGLGDPSPAAAQETDRQQAVNHQDDALEARNDSEGVIKTIPVPPPVVVLRQKSVSTANNPPLPEPDTALWRLGDEDTTIYLLGTVHIFPEGTRWQNDAIREAIDTADELIVETNDDAGVMKIFGALALRAFDATQPPLLDRLPEEQRPAVAARVDALTEKMGVSRSFFDKLDTWAVAFMLTEIDEEEEEEFVFYSGAEVELEEEFGLLEKPVGELETWQSQLDIFDQLSAEAQIDWLQSSLAENRNLDEELDGVLDSWIAGDVETIDMTDEIVGARSEEILEALLYRRNRNWVDWIVDRLDEPGTILVAVGAGHLAGPNSVQDYLGKRGFTVERVR